MAAVRSTGPAHVIEDEGVARTQRSSMNFTGSGVAVADTGGKTVVTVPGGTLGTTLKEWYVDTAATPGGNGRTHASAFTTFAAAIAAASPYDRINVLSDLNEACTINVQGIHMLGIGRPVLYGGSGSSINDKAINVIATDVTIENFRFLGHAGWKGTALCLNRPSGGARVINFGVLGTGGAATATWYPTSPGTGSKTGIGGIGFLCHYAEGGEPPYFEKINTNRCSIGMAHGTWSTRQQVNTWFSSECGQDLVIGMFTGDNSAVATSGAHGYGQTGLANPENAQCGSSTFWNCTFVSAIGDFTTAPNVDIIGGGTGSTDFLAEMGGRNTFVKCDWNESGANSRVRIGTILNTFINMTAGIATRIEVEGQLNKFINFYNMAQQMEVKSSSNSIQNQYGAGGLNLTGGSNLVENIALTATGINGTGANNKISRMYGGQLNVAGSGWTYDHVLPSTIVSYGTSPIFPVRQTISVLTYAGTMTPATYLGYGMLSSVYTIEATNAIATTIANPTNPNPGQEFTIEFKNSASGGGAHGTLNVGNKFSLVGGGTVLWAGGTIANGKRRLLHVYYNATDDKFVEKYRSAADM